MVLAKEVRMGLEVSESQMEGNRSGLWQSSALPAERPQKFCNNLGQESFFFSVSASLEVDKKILKSQKLETEGWNFEPECVIELGASPRLKDAKTR